MTQPRTRIAPTPSGYLHLGNIANFLLIERLAANGTLALRIDDCDATRARPDYIESIFSTLQWLGIQWHEGPRDSADFAANFSQSNRKAYYFERLQALSCQTYACACSRKEASGNCNGTCREKRIPFMAGTHAIRLHITEPALAEKFGDVILWRKDGGPAYQWVSVIDDLDQKMNLIVRGDDLRNSSELQKHLAGLITPEGFSRVRFMHHPLIKGEEGEKLSKSQGAPSVEELKAQGITSAELRRQLEPVIQEWLGQT